jgi:hypothetical protein
MIQHTPICISLQNKEKVLKWTNSYLNWVNSVENKTPLNNKQNYLTVECCGIYEFFF